VNEEIERAIQAAEAELGARYATEDTELRAALATLEASQKLLAESPLLDVCWPITAAYHALEEWTERLYIRLGEGPGGVPLAQIDPDLGPDPPPALFGGNEECPF
jgi:hypothetical protein